MVQMRLLWWSKTTATATSSITYASQKHSKCYCMSKKTLSKLFKNLKKHGAKMLQHQSNLISGTKPPPSSSSFQCRYDPLSYSLNFDGGTLVDEEDYFYKFYSFSSRFVATSKPSSSPTLQD